MNKREKIQIIWRRVYGHDNNVSLVGGERDWQFFEALLDEERMERRDRVIAAASRGRRVGDSVRVHCGDVVRDRADPRHEARVDAVLAGRALVRFVETGWRGEIKLGDIA